MKKIILAVVMLCGMGTVAHAQLDGGICNHLGIGIGVGTTGIDIELATPVTDYLQVRAGISFLPEVSVNNIKVNMPSSAMSAWNNYQKDIDQWGNIDFSQVQKNGQPLSEADKKTFNELTGTTLPNKIEAKGTFKRTDFKFLLDVYPVPNLSFHFTTGFFVGTSDIISVTNTNCQSQLQAVTDYNANLAGQTFTYQGHQTIQFGAPIYADFEKTTIEPNGPNITAKLKTKGFKPYLGIGFGRAVPKKTRLAFACDLGVQFWGKPEFLVQNKTLTENDIDEDFLKTVNTVSVYPVMSFRLCGKIF